MMLYFAALHRLVLGKNNVYFASTHNDYMMDCFELILLYSSINTDSLIRILHYFHIQVFPGAWTAILVYLDNAGAWNLRAANLDRWYLGQETYMRIVNPEPDPRNKTEVPTPDNVLYCGALNYLQKYDTVLFFYNICG